MTDRDSWNDAESAAPAPAKKKMSGCLLATLIVGGVGLLGVLVCCGVGSYFAMNYAPKISKEPADVNAVAKQILNTEMLADFNPDNSLSWPNPAFDIRMAEYKQKDGKGELMLGYMKLNFGDPSQMKAQSGDFRKGFEGKIENQLDVKKTEAHEITVNGQKASVKIGEATERNTGKGFHTVTADFDQSGGQTFVLMKIDDEIWDQDAVLKFFEDAKAP